MKLINGNGTAAEWARAFASQAELRLGVRINRDRPRSFHVKNAVIVPLSHSKCLENLKKKN